MPITPDSKNWTWVLERPCPECGFDASTVDYRDVPRLTRENAVAWPAVLERADVRQRPDDSTWSPLEYAAHVRDVFRVFQIRLALMRSDDAPQFENWDQDKTAEEEKYGEQDPTIIAGQLVASAESLAEAFEAVPDGDLARTGLRSDGNEFTIETLARYYIHDPVHHLWDVRG